MEFRSTKIPGAFIIEPTKLEDERGFFAQTWCAEEFAAHGLSARLTQCSISFNKKKGTLRGMHYQVPPHEQAKLVRCTKGAIYDVVVDLRRDSPTFKQWVAAELTSNNRLMFYIPEGTAHGFQTLEAETEIFYQITGMFMPECERGVRWNDPAFGIEWPLALQVIASRDASYKDMGE